MMMATPYVEYDPVTGKIIGRLRLSPDQEKHYKNILQIDQATYDAAPERTMRVNLIGLHKVVPKNQVDVHASKESFTANGIDSATITYTGLTASADVYINKIKQGAVSQGDTTVVITSDSAGDFIVEIQSLADYADAITVKAQ